MPYQKSALAAAQIGDHLIDDLCCRPSTITNIKNTRLKVITGINRCAAFQILNDEGHSRLD